MIFIVNFAVLLGFTVHYFRKRQFKAAICNFAILMLFFIFELIDFYYLEIRDLVFDLLGEDIFNVVKNILSAVLFFGGSITVGVQFLSELLSLFALLFVATKVIKFFKKHAAKVFSVSVFSEDEKVENKYSEFFCKHYLVLKRLLN